MNKTTLNDKTKEDVIAAVRTAQGEIIHIGRAPFLECALIVTIAGVNRDLARVCFNAEIVELDLWTGNGWQRFICGESHSKPDGPTLGASITSVLKTATTAMKKS